MLLILNNLCVRNTVMLSLQKKYKQFRINK